MLGWMFDPLHGDGYQFWSGIGSDVFLLAPFAVFYRRHNCHVDGCWRIQFKPHPDKPGHVVCRKHHREVS
jgi:hypothetical protein